MHDTAYEHGRLFFELYWQPGYETVVDLGSMDVNGSLRDHCPPDARYIGLDLEPGPGVDQIVEPGAVLPFEDGSVDVVVSTSAFEHDIFFWETFLELARIVRPGGLIYLDAPSNNDFHRYPLDCWRFYPDAGIALARWSAKRGVGVELVESFVGEPGQAGWADFVAVFRKPSPEPLQLTARIAERTSAVNAFSGSETDLDHFQQSTYEVREIARLKDELARATERADQLAADAESARADAESARADAESARVGAESAHAALHEVRTSTSWRATAPLRRVTEIVRRR